MIDLQAQLDEIHHRSALTAVGAAFDGPDRNLQIAVSGRRSRHADTPVTPADLWHTGSVGKSMTATLVATLFHDQLDTPWLSLPRVQARFGNAHEAWQSSSLRHLLTSTGGLPANFPLKYLRHTDSTDSTDFRTDALAEVLSRPPRAPVGSRFRYSNLGYTLAGHVCEIVWGESYPSLLAKHVCTPLGMASVGFGAPPGEQPHGHQVILGWRREIHPDRPLADNPPLITPAGRMHMTLGDLAAFGRAHLDMHKGVGPLAHLVSDGLHTPLLADYACGWIVADEPWCGPIIWHNGSNRYWYCLLILFPELDAIAAFTTNDGARFRGERAFFNAAREIAETLHRQPS